jgi:hypothetical protein
MNSDKRLINKLISNPHELAKLCGFKDLNEIHSEWIKLCWYGSPKHIALQASRGSYKTSSVIIFGCALNALLRPERSCAVVTKNEAASSAALSAIYKTVASGAMRNFYYLMTGDSYAALNKNQRSLSLSTYNSNSPEGQISAIGIKGSVTRKHFDDIVIDDIITIEDRLSAKEREYTLEILRELTNNIAKPNSRIIFTGTPWHKEDAWNYIKSFCGEIHKYPISSLDFIPKEKIQAARETLTPPLFAINYELEIKRDESLLFHEPKRGAVPIGEWAPIIHVDASYGGADTTAATITDGVHLHGVTRRGHVIDHIQEINALADKYGARVGYCEDNGDKGFLARELRKGSKVKWRAYHESQNKEYKITTYLFSKWKDIIVSNDTDSEYLDQILEFSEISTGRDDAPDSAASALRELTRKGNIGVMPNTGGLQ